MRTTFATCVALGLAAACSSPPNHGAGHNGTTNTGTGRGSSTAQLPPKDDLPELPADPREKTLSQATADLLSTYQVLHHPVDDEISETAFPKFIEALDGAKLVLLQSDVDKLNAYRDAMDDELKGGSLDLARKGAALVADRQKQAAAMVADLLTKPFDFTQVEELETDPDKREYAKTDDELRTRWRQVLKQQALERLQQMDDLLDAAAKAKAGTDKDKAAAAAKVVADIPDTFEKREAKVRDELTTRFASRFARLQSEDKLEPVENFINAIAAAYDPHTQYFAPVEKANFDIGISGKLEGIGAALKEQDHYVVVDELVPGGAASLQGKLEAGDLILAVAQDKDSPVDVTDMPIDKVVSMIRGPTGTKVTLTVKKPTQEIQTITIVRNEVKIEATYARGAILKPAAGSKDAKVGYIYLPGFYGDLEAKKDTDRNAAKDVRALVQKFEDKKIGALVLDVRSNGGGILPHARDISGLFIDEGPVVQTRDTEGKVEVLSDTDEGVVYSGRVVVLVDKFSASATEILAAALQDYQRAVIVGAAPSTHGKGTVQTFVDMDRLTNNTGDPIGDFKITIEQYFRVNGGSVQLRGVVPDIVLPDPNAYIEGGEKSLYHPIPWTSIDTTKFSPVPHSWVVSDLAAASAARVKADPVFAKVTALGDVLKARRDKTTVPLERTAWEADRKAAIAEADKNDPELDKQKPRLGVDLLDETEAGTTDKAVKKKLDDWTSTVARDPWIDEAVHILADMSPAKTAAKTTTTEKVK